MAPKRTVVLPRTARGGSKHPNSPVYIPRRCLENPSDNFASSGCDSCRLSGSAPPAQAPFAAAGLCGSGEGERHACAAHPHTSASSLRFALIKIAAIKGPGGGKAGCQEAGRAQIPPFPVSQRQHANPRSVTGVHRGGAGWDPAPPRVTPQYGDPTPRQGLCIPAPSHSAAGSHSPGHGLAQGETIQKPPALTPQL